MEEQELSGLWKVVSWLITAVVMFLLGLLGIIIADAVGSKSKFFAYGGFIIGWSCYSLIKAILLKLTNNNSEKDPVEVDFDTISMPYTTDECFFDDSQKITHELRKTTLEVPYIWKFYMDFVKYALSESIYKEQLAALEKSTDHSNDYCIELIGANYAKNHIFNDIEWSKELQRETAISSNTLSAIAINAKTHIKENLERINSAIQNNDESKEDFIMITARIAARKLWADMFEYSYKSEILKL